MNRRWNIFIMGAHMGWRATLADVISVIGSFLIYATIMILYGGVIRLIPDADLAPFSLTHAQMIWYLGTTELILFTSASWGFKDVQASFISQEAYLGILRPASYAFVRFSFWAGESLVRIVLFFPLYLVLMGWLAGGFVMSWGHVLGVLFSMPLAALMMNCAAYIIGASCLWFVQSDPAAWVWQKLIFLLGAMLWPLIFYPVWLQKVIWLLPFHGILAHGGNWTLNFEPKIYVLGFLNQIVWASIFLWFLRVFNRIVLRRVQSGKE